ncbi:MAG: tetraacyldisaccharide 4'-kinase [Planctomycetaceae bacterium]
MDERFAIDVLSGRRRGIVPAALRSLCTAAAWGYRAGVQVRNAAYDRGWKPVERVEAPVISLGNLTTGGTGKTPLAAFFAEQLLALGHRPGIVSRGYRSLNDQANDERLVLEQLLPDVPQMQQPDRVRGAQEIISRHGCDVILLDDGFQHRRLHRDLDLVLIDATQPWGFGRLLPRGLLREPLSALRRADGVIITRCDQVAASELAAIRRELQRWRGTDDCVEVRFAPKRLCNAAGERQALPQVWPGRCLGFCGIGNPQGFQHALTKLGVEGPLEIFPDHHHYTDNDLRRLSDLAQSQSASCVLTTQKDLVKLSDAALGGVPLWGLEIAAEIVSGDSLLAHWLEPLRPGAKKVA